MSLIKSFFNFILKFFHFEVETPTAVSRVFITQIRFRDIAKLPTMGLPTHVQDAIIRVFDAFPTVKCLTIILTKPGIFQYPRDFDIESSHQIKDTLSLDTSIVHIVIPDIYMVSVESVKQLEEDFFSLPSTVGIVYKDSIDGVYL